MNGKVTFDGQGTRHIFFSGIRSHEYTDIREFSVDSWRGIIGVVPQDPILFTGTIASNIAYGNPTATREQIEHAAREANCEFVWGMPKGFDTESEYIPACLTIKIFTTCSHSWSNEFERWTTATPCDCKSFAEKTGYPCPRRSDKFFGRHFRT